jgi:hypothetical protein
MITTFEDYSPNPITLPDDEAEDLINEYLLSATPKICCLEAYWSAGMIEDLSVKPFLKSIPLMIEKEIVVMHRFISSSQDLAFYVQSPDGIIYQDPRLAGIDVFYLAMHGNPGVLNTPITEIKSEELISIFHGLASSFNIVYFGGCDVFAGEKGKHFAQDFLSQTGTVAVVGYSEPMSWIDSLLIDTLFISRFFDIPGNPFEHVQMVYNSVIRDYPLAKRCGFSLFIHEEYLSSQTGGEYFA